MCACHIGSSPNTPGSDRTPVDLDDFCDYIKSEGMDESGAAPDDGPQDVYTQLAQKEHDLILAAELGKALLDKNKELEKKYEQLSEEYNHQIEELVQEKHELKLRLEAVETEYESTCRELQNDVTALRQELKQQTAQTGQRDKSRSQIVSELTQQNERLTAQLRKATKDEESLQLQLHELRDQVHNRRASMHEHVTQLEVLRGEITMLTERKGDLERRITMLTDERDSLSCNLEEAQDRILMLERQKIEHECMIRTQEKEISDLQEHNTSLEERVSDISSLNVTNTSLSQQDVSVNSLFNELEMTQLSQSMTMSTDSLDDTGQASYVQQHRAVRPHTLAIPSVMLTSAMMAEVIDDDIECDDEMAMCTNMSNMSSDSLGEARSGYINSVDSEFMEFKQELLEVYRLLKGMVHELRGNREVFSPQTLGMSDLKVGTLLSVCNELKGLLQDLMQQKTSMNSDEEDQPESVQDPHLKAEIHRLKKELLQTRHELTRTKKDVELKNKELENKSKELLNLTGKIEGYQGKLSQMQAERDKLQDAAAGLLTKDDIIEQTRQERDAAINKHNKLELELNKMKLDMLALDNQLMDSIQQKLELSQRLEEWQIDMEELLQMNMKKRIDEEKKKDSSGTSTPPTPQKSPRRRFPFKL